ncbi:uncharacterized protein LOC103519628 [Diaphorina citri]|uniref:Uncharacterized protein LOC103519628 n=1 Tax=Diaphorina citri TaxID=121845 RepID=A0A1S4ENL5_DIACI|nr:uncharacterized protein LOC103519628 [Diaphorina citri]
MLNRAISILDLSMRELYEQYCTIEPTNLIFNAPLGNVGEFKTLFTTEYIIIKEDLPESVTKEIFRLYNILSTDYRGTVFIIAEHGDHWHVLHDCTYTSSQCRCARVKAVTRCFGIRIKRRTIRSLDFNTSYATNVIYYLGRGGRKINYIQIGEYASRRGPGVEVGDLSDGKSAESGAQSVVETRTVENEMRIFLGCTDRGESGGAAEGSGTPLSNQPGSTHKRRKGDKYLAFLEAHPCAPLANVLSTRQWATGPFKYDNRNDPLLRNVMLNRAISILDLSMRELYDRTDKSNIQRSVGQRRRVQNIIHH